MGIGKPTVDTATDRRRSRQRQSSWLTLFSGSDFGHCRYHGTPFSLTRLWRIQAVAGSKGLFF